MQLGIKVQIVTQYSGYFLLGYFLHYHLPTYNKYKLFTYAILTAIVSWIFTATCTYLLLVRAGGVYNGFFIKSPRPNIIILSVCIFLILKLFPYESFLLKNKFVLSIINGLSKKSFGIYLLHILVLETYGRDIITFILGKEYYYPFLNIPITTVTTILVCYFIIAFLQKIPLIKNIIA